MTILSFSGVNVVAASDVTAPILSSPTGTQTGQTTADGTVTTDEDNGTLYYLVSANATENLATVKAGLSQAVSATGSQSVSVTGLTAATNYYLHYAHTDAAANDSAVVSSAQFTTASAVSSVVLSFTGVNVVAVRNQISSVSGFNLDSALTVNTDNAVNLTTATTITATLGGQSLTGITVADSDTFTAAPITGGLQIGVEHDLILTVDGLVSNAYAVTLGNKSGHNTVTQITPHAEAFYKDYSGVGPDLIGADDLIIHPLQTDDLRNLTVHPNGLVDVEGAGTDPDDQVFDYFYLDAQDGYARSPTQTFTIYNQVDTPDDLVVIDSITPNRTSAVVNFSYPGSDVTSYEYNIGGAWITCTSPLTIPSLTEETLYTLNIRPKNINSVGTSTQDTFTTLSAVDTTPNAFTITPLAGQLLSDAVTFAAFTVSGVDAGVDIPVTITGGTYSVNTGSGWGAETSSNTNVRLNYQIRVHHTTSASYSDPVSSVITVGGVEGTATSTTKADDVIPVITLVGGASIDINEGDTYSDVLGTTVTASDNVDGDISNNITVTGSVDGNTVGTYTLTYNVSDAAGNAATTVTRTVRVADITLPVITLVGSSTVTHRQGTAYTDAGATATDATDGNLTSSIVTTGTLFDSNTVGAYTIRYNVTDSEGNAATEVTRTVNVTDQTNPVISLSSSSISITQGTPYTDSGVTATDNNDGDITADIVTTGSVDVNTIGSYTLSYSVTDAAGNVGTASRVVSVLFDGVVTVDHVTPKYLMLVTEASNYTSSTDTITIPSGTYAFVNDGTYIPKAPNKDPSSTIDYGVYWADWLSSSDTITANEWILDSGLTAVSKSNNDTEAAVMISGGTAGTQYTAVNRITTSEGRTVEASMYILCENR